MRAQAIVFALLFPFLQALEFEVVSVKPSAPGSGMSANADLGRPTIFTAVQEQLGLRLESERGPVEILVIDGAARPAAN